MKKRIAFALLFCISLLFCAQKTTPARAQNDETIKIYSFNIQIFGRSKMQKSEVVKTLVEIVSQADLTAVQEVRAADPAPVNDFMALLPPRYNYVLGPREGRTNSQEQYWFIFDSEKLEAKESALWDDTDDIFEREPFAVYFKTRGNFDFIVVNNHLKPAAAEAEINALPKVVEYFRELWGEDDVIVLGDFNADGNYYNEEALSGVFNGADYNIVIKNDIDTTVAASANTYDRIIITGSAVEDWTGNSGVILFDAFETFPARGIKAREVSDHYPVFSEFFINHDTD